MRALSVLILIFSLSLWGLWGILFRIGATFYFHWEHWFFPVWLRGRGIFSAFFPLGIRKEGGGEWFWTKTCLDFLDGLLLFNVVFCVDSLRYYTMYYNENLLYPWELEWEGEGGWEMWLKKTYLFRKPNYFVFFAMAQQNKYLLNCTCFAPFRNHKNNMCFQWKKNIKIERSRK